MKEGFEILKAFTIATPFLGKIIGRPFAMTVSREFNYREDPDKGILDEMRRTYQRIQGADYEDFRDRYRKDHGIRAVFAHFSMVDDYTMDTPLGKKSMKEFIMPTNMRAGGIEIASSARTAMFHAIKGAEAHSAIVPARVLGAPLLSYAFPVFDEAGVLVGGVSFGIDISQTVSTVHRLRELAKNHDDESLANLSLILSRELDKACAAALSVRKQAEQTKRLAKSIQDLRAQVGDVAEQLKVLAINTAIEATKVGGSGKGVGVIASKMKEISEFTSRVLAEIADESVQLEVGAGKVLDTSSVLLDGAKTLQKESEILTTTSERLGEQKRNMERMIESSVESVAHSRENLEAIYKLIPDE